MSRSESRPAYLALTILALWVFFFLALDTAVAKAPTVDETLHVARGGALWQGQDFRIQTQPPLSFWINGLFLSTEPTFPELSDLQAWSDGNIKEISDELYGGMGVNIDRLFFLARLPIILAALLFGAFLAAWTMRWRRLVATSLILLFFSLSPNLIAFAALATTDLVTAVTYAVACLTAWSCVQRPSGSGWLAASVALGLALSAKLTALILLPVTLLLFASRWKPGSSLRDPLYRWARLLPAAALVVWAAYRFEIGTVSGLPVAVPAATYVSDFQHAQWYVTRGHPAFFMGELSSGGWWYYFPVAFVLKTPLPVLLYLPITFVALIRNASQWRDTVFIWLPSGTLFAVASAGKLNIGYRHILPVLPFLWLGAAYSLPTALRTRPDMARVVIAAMVLWYAAGTLIQHPHHLAFFNRIVGPENGYRYLGDSNVDWGQDLKLLAAFADNRDAGDTYFSYFGPISPAYYGMEQEPLFAGGKASADFSPANPAPGRYAISATHLQGAVLSEPDLFDWFWRRQPAGSLGHSILLYDVEEAVPGEWIAHCLSPEPILAEGAAEALVGAGSVRHVYFDCSSGWVFPGSGGPGWYVLPEGISLGPVASRFPEQLQEVYAEEHRGYRIAYWDGEGDLESALTDSSGSVSTSAKASVTLPVSAGGKARLLAYWPASRLSSDTLWATVWQAQEPDVGLSVAGHLQGAQGEPLVDDGLAFSSEQWQEGDFFIQHHRFPAAQAARTLATGLYYYGSGQRLPFEVEGGAASLLYLQAADGR